MRLTSLICAVITLAACGAPQQEAAKDIDWPTYLGDNGRQHYSSLDQVTRDNVSRLELAWSYNSGDPSGSMYTSPLVIDGVFYGLSPSLVPFALNAATGEEIWRNDLDIDGGAQRGLMWWANGDDKRLFFSQGKTLIAISAHNGELIAGFGDNGKVDMTPKDIERAYMGVTVPGVVFEDNLIMGFSTTEDEDAYPGSIRAFSALTGEIVWTFNTIPARGDPGSETWAEGSLDRAGGANVWSGMALDEDRGILFAPTGSATPDFYGANRLGDNLYANCLLAIDVRTGELQWHHQVFKHDLWDRDNPSPPTLVQLQRDGKTIDAVAITTKSGQLFAFDRDTGESMYDLIAVETLPSTIPGEVPAPVQHVSPVVISRQTFEVTNRTPEATKFVEDKIKDWDLRPWAPPRLGTVLLYPWYDGGGEWGGSAFDPANNRLIVNSNDEAGILTLSEIPVGFSNFGAYASNCGACHGMKLEGTDLAPSLVGVLDRMDFAELGELMDAGIGRMPSFSHLDDTERRGVFRYIASPELEEDEPSTEVRFVLSSGYVYLRDHEDLPGNSPPWGTLNSIDLATGEIAWKINFGNFLSHPDLDYGSISYGGPVVTASGLIFIAATPDKLFRAYDSQDGTLLWETELSAAGFSTPAIYSVDGKQYISIAAGGSRLGPPSGSEYFTYALPTANESPE
jgi:quinoprotein glucose dehydrogenase